MVGIRRYRETLPVTRRALLTAREVALFLLLWPQIGFTLGLSTLLGPVMWVTASSRRAGLAPAAAENTRVIVVIILYLVVSTVASLWIARIAAASSPGPRLGLIGLVLACTVGSIALALSPSSLADLGTLDRIGPRFTIGPYPDPDRLALLRNEGFTGVISLLHPAVIPFEPIKLAEEEESVTDAGLEFIHAPMLPWIGDNTESLETIRRLAARQTGRYYVHCYLGRDRVQLARRVIEATAGQGRVVSTLEARSIDRKGAFERGDIYRLDEGLHLTPYPTDEEFLSYIASGPARVVSLMDPAIPENQPWVEKETEFLETHGIPFEILPPRRVAPAGVPGPFADPWHILSIARRIRELERPVVVHAFLSPSTGRSPDAEALLQAFRSDRPPLPPSVFIEPMSAGRVEVLAPDVAAGPRPTPSEFGGYLSLRGVGAFVYLGDDEDPPAREDAAVARGHGLTWTSWDGRGDPPWEMEVDAGPWYLYGPGLEAVGPTVVAARGPAIPEQSLGAVASDTGRAAAADLVRRGLPGTRLILTLGPVLLLGTAAAGAVVGRARTTFGIATPYTRKLFHFVIFTMAAVLHATAGLPGVVLLGAIVSGAVLFALIRGDGFPFYEALARPGDAPHRSLFILVPLLSTALGGVLSNVWFGSFAIVGYLVGGWGDAVGEPVGAAWGRRRYRVPSLANVVVTRSLEGSAAVMVAGSIAAFVGLWLGGTAMGVAALVGVACGVAGAVVEAFSHHGLDNLTIQVAASGIAFALLA